MSRAPRSKSAKKGGGAKNPWSQADKFTKQAKAEGYLARSVYKLDEIIAGDGLDEVITALIAEDQAARLAALED